MMVIGNLYENGLEVEKDAKEAGELYQKQYIQLIQRLKHHLIE